MKRNSICISILLMAILLFVIGCTRSFNAELTSQKVVESVLKAPSTVNFDEIIKFYDKDKNYVFLLVIDAENSFGAKIRGYYLVGLKNCVAFQEYDSKSIREVESKKITYYDIEVVADEAGFEYDRNWKK